MAKHGKGVVDIEKALKDAAKDVGTSLKSRLATPTSTWNHKPKFVTRIGEVGGDLSVQAYTDDDAYFFLDGGTEKRYAVMEKGFVSKTQPGMFNARAGFGTVAYRLKRNMRHRPGIKPRKWTQMAALEYSVVLPAAIDRIVAQYGDGKRLFSFAKRIRGVIDE